MRAGGVYGSMVSKHGPESAEAAAAKTTVRAIRARLAVEDLINSAPAPTPGQIEALRRLLSPAVTR
ncbi:hypothetical protein ACFXA2_25995 [Micromonospora chalcea]